MSEQNSRQPLPTLVEREERFKALLSRMNTEQLKRMLDFTGKILSDLPVPAKLAPQEQLSRSSEQRDSLEE